MKMKILSTLFIACVVSATGTFGTERIDLNTTYNPAANICMASFGNNIHTREMLNMPHARERMVIIRSLLIQWINEENASGFFLQEYESNEYYWQFVETKKYVGVILLATADHIKDDFYTTLGAGLNRNGHSFYGLNITPELNGDVVSMVIDKSSAELIHFENWKFQTPESDDTWMTRTYVKQIASKKELAAFKKYYSETDFFPYLTLTENIACLITEDFLNE
jgi:hypothetical protein